MSQHTKRFISKGKILYEKLGKIKLRSKLDFQFKIQKKYKLILFCSTGGTSLMPNILK